MELESWEWRVANYVLNECVRWEYRRWIPESVSAYVYCRARETNSKRAFDCLSVADQLAWHTDGWMR